MATFYQVIKRDLAGTELVSIDVYPLDEYADHAAQAGGVNSPDASRYSWTTTRGNLIHAFSFADDITFNATAPLGGSVHALQAVDSYVVGGMAGDLVAMTAGTEGYWRAILAGETTIVASGWAALRIAGDFGTVAAVEVLTGAADVFEGAIGADFTGYLPPYSSMQAFSGDADKVEGVLTGGDDIITMRNHGSVAGDADSVRGTLYGGNDTIVLDGTIEDEADIAHTTTFVAGDALSVSTPPSAIAPLLVGGNDKILVRNYAGNAISGDVRNGGGRIDGGADLIDASANSREVILYGDVQNVSGGELRGGNDRLIGNAIVGSILSGDAGDLNFAAVLRAGADRLTGGLGDDQLYGDYRTLTSGSVQIDSVYTGDDKIYGGGGRDTLLGQVGDDTLDGGAGDDILNGGTQTAGTGDIAAFNTLNVGVSVDLVTGVAFGQGTDTLLDIESVRGSNSADSLAGNNLGNRLEGLDGNDQLFGRGGDDTLYGGTGNDKLNGGAGNDRLRGDAGVDVATGGTGNDSYYVDNGADEVIEKAGEGRDKVYASVDYTLATGQEVEYLVACEVGTPVGLTLGGNEKDNYLTGGAGIDHLNGNAGNDRLNGDAGADVMAGGDGDDTYYVDNALDAVSEAAGKGRDKVYASVDYTLAALQEVEYLLVGEVAAGIGLTLGGNELDNYLTGGAGIDHLNGAAGNDRLKGQAGADVMAGGEGDDTYYVDDEADEVIEAAGEGNDSVSSSVDYTLAANQEIECLRAWGIGADTGVALTGNEHANYLVGGAGSDTLDGGAGNDRLSGGNSADVFVFGLGSGHDVVKGFETGSDRVDLSAWAIADFGALMAFASESAGNTMITLGASDRIQLSGVLLSQLQSADFML
jgi:Ca2+-binding RTX toxin-like protein